MALSDLGVLLQASSHVREARPPSESQREPLRVTPKASHVGTISAPHRDDAPRGGARLEAGLRDRQPGMTSATHLRGSSNMNTEVAWRCYRLQSKSLELFDERRAFDVQELGSAIPISSGSIKRSLNEITLNRRKIRGHVEAILGKFHERRLI
jgi:hypothetical protein